MKIIALGDTHGRNRWKEIIKQHPDADRIIFLGDYFDSFNIPFDKQWNNFLDIIKFKQENLDKVVLLFANHEYHYMTRFSSDRYSGHQLQYAGKIEKILEACIEQDLLKIAHMEVGFLFTHAGVTKTWLEDNKLAPGGVAAMINSAFKTRPQIFRFTPSTGLDNYGDSITQTPIWVRPRALLSDLPEGYRQVVGHTHQPKGIDVSGKVIFIDTLEYGNEYLIINDGIPEVGTVK